jgi:hypothetical protein
MICISSNFIPTDISCKGAKGDNKERKDYYQIRRALGLEPEANR